MRKFLVLGIVFGGLFYGLRNWQGAGSSTGPLRVFAQTLPGGARLSAVAIGHEYRQDDVPSIAAAPDGSIWVAWLSFAGDRDDVGIRCYCNQRWSNIHWVPATSGDTWLPQVAADARGRVWVIWSQQSGANWDIYARRFDPERQEWGALERLTSDPLPDINPRIWSDGKGRAALVWQGFRGKNSNIFLKTLDGEKWSKTVRVTNRAANDWDPAVAMDSGNIAWVAYDSYKNGNYDVFLTRVKAGEVQGPELSMAATPAFEARATVAVDAADRVWVAWEAGGANWGKDNGTILRGRQAGVPLGGAREPRIRCYMNGEFRDPETPLKSAFRDFNTYQPHVFSDGRGSVWVVAMMRRLGPKRPVFPPQPGYWEYWVTHLDGGKWSDAFPLPNSKGRSSTHMGAALTGSGSIWMTWPTDNRSQAHYHRPIRQQIFAAEIPAPALLQPHLRPTSDERLEDAPTPDVETGDVRAIRTYTIASGGKMLHILRGDFHRHTEQSWDEGGDKDGSVEDFCRYMIDAAAMDFGAITDHQGGAWPYWWWYTQKITDMYLVPGVFVPVFGYERSASFPFGHRNMFFAKRSEARVSPFFLREGAKTYQFPLSPEGDEPSDETGALAQNDTQLLYEETQQHNGISIPHTSATPNFGTDWADNDPEVEPVVEIFQGCRLNSEAPNAPYAFPKEGSNSKGWVANAWAKGYKLGIITSSDHVSTHISYAMVYTSDFTRQGILDAVRSRHTYGATDNIILDVRMGAHLMGDEFVISRVEPLSIKIRGTKSISLVEVIRDGVIIYSTSPNRQDVGVSYADPETSGGKHYYYVRVRQADGMLAWSSPMFVQWKR